MPMRTHGLEPAGGMGAAGAVVGMTNGPIEPSADLREMASMLRQTYVALVMEGFTTQEALVIIGQILSAANGSGA